MFSAAEQHNKNPDVGSLPFVLRLADTEMTGKIGEIQIALGVGFLLRLIPRPYF